MKPLIDSFGRRISYIRLSVTDRCDLRCRYCMPQRMQFLPRREILTIEELVRLSDLLIARGVTRIRLTGGEPLVRRGVIDLADQLGQRIGQGLEELTLTTNGTRLEECADQLSRCGIRRVNVSLDSLDAERFAHITRGGELGRVLRGIAAAADAGIRIKINTVALRGINEDEIEALLLWCSRQGHDLTLIETMPLGRIEEDRTRHYLPLDVVKRAIETRFRLEPSSERTGGPARYFDVPDLGVRLGLITPLTNNFCTGCNRIRIAATGTVYGCLGHDQKIELRDLLRTGDDAEIGTALDRLLGAKPRGHEFMIEGSDPAVERTMSLTGG